MAHVHCMLDTYGYMYTLRICNTAFQCNSGCMNALQCYIKCILPVLCNIYLYASDLCLC